MTKKLTVVALVAALSLSGSADLVAHFKMGEVVTSNGNRFVKDLSGNGRDLKLGDDVDVVYDSVLGKVLNFPGTTKTYATFTCPAITNRTISFWLYRQASDATIANGQPYAFATVSGMGFLWGKDAASTVQPMMAVDGTTCAFSACTTCTRSLWHHVAVTVEDTGALWQDAAGVSRPKVNYRLYLDGSKAVAVDGMSITNFVATAQTAILGNMNTTAAMRPLNGALGEFKVYDTCLSHEEIMGEYLSCCREVLGQRLCYHWKMDAVSTDAAGNRVIADECGNCDLMLGNGCVISNAGPRGVARSLWFDCTTASWGRATNTVGRLEEYTLSFWANYDQVLADKKPTDGNNNPRGYQTAGGKCLFSFNLGSNSRKISLNPGPNTAIVGLSSPGFWHHYTVVVRKYGDPSKTAVALGNSELYINGRFVTTNALANVEGRVLKNAEIVVGNSGQAKTRPFAGLMRDFKVYNYALSKTEVYENYLDEPIVSAGDDFTVFSDVAHLAGETDAERCGKRPSDPMWSCVLAPMGASPVFSNPNAWSPCVTLPMEGSYVFRLTATSLGGVQLTDDVTVVRATGSASAPSVSATAASASVTLPAGCVLNATATAGARIFWSKQSGHGGVYFTSPYGTNTCAMFTAPGEYTLVCTADVNGEQASTLVPVTVSGTFTAGPPSDGLLYHWDFDNYTTQSGTIGCSTCPLDPISGNGPSTPLENNGGTTLSNLQVRGVTGFAWRQLGQTNCMLLGNDKLASGINYAFSFWAYEHSDDPHKVIFGRIFVCSNVFQIQMDNMRTGNPTMLVRLYGKANGAASGSSKEYYWSFANVGNLSGNGSVLDRWVHYVVNVDVSDYTASVSGANGYPVNKVRVFADGRELMCTANNATAANLAYMTNSAGRIVFRQFVPSSNVQLCVGLNQTDDRGSRFYPATIDELRVYDRNLAVGEVWRLYGDSFSINRAPTVDVPETEVSIYNHATTTLDCMVHDDGIPRNVATIQSTWEVMQGDADKLLLPSDPLSGSVGASAPGSYRIRLKATDGLRVAYSDNIDITVKPNGLVIIVE